METRHRIFELITKGDRGGLLRLLDEDASAARAEDGQGQSPLLFAQYHRRTELAEILLARAGTRDIFEAAALGDRARLEQLLDAEPGFVNAVSPDGFSPLHLACLFGQLGCVEAILGREELDLEQRSAIGLRALHAAAAHGSLDIVEALLDAGAEVDAADELGETALHLAARRDQTELAQLLLKYGARTSGATEARAVAGPAVLALLDELEGMFG